MNTPPPSKAEPFSVRLGTNSITLILGLDRPSTPELGIRLSGGADIEGDARMVDTFNFIARAVNSHDALFAAAKAALALLDKQRAEAQLTVLMPVGPGVIRRGPIAEALAAAIALAEKGGM